MTRQAVREEIILDEAAIDVQKHLKKAVKGRGTTRTSVPRRVSAWLLSMGEYPSHRLVVTVQEIRPPLDPDEVLRIREDISDFAFCKVHGFIPRGEHDFRTAESGRDHVLTPGHKPGDYTVKPDGNLPDHDQVYVRVSRSRFGCSEPDVAICTSLWVRRPTGGILVKRNTEEL